MFEQLAEYVSGEWWSYLIVFGLAYLDVLFPLVPSETAVITAGVLAGSGEMSLALTIPVAAAGAFCGDNTAFFIGRHFEHWIQRVLFRTDKARERLRWAERQINERGGELIVVGRFIPGGRTAVTLSCGWLEMPWRRFAPYDAAAGIVWASYASLLGYLGGKSFREEPWKGLLIALLLALVVTGGVELGRWLYRRRKHFSRGSRPQPEAE